MTNSHWNPSLGALLLDNNRCQFTVWAPNAKSVDVHLLGENERYVPMERGEFGYFRAVVDGVSAGQRYCYRLDQSDEYADPASRFQPDGVHGPSEVVDPAFDWHDQDWTGLPLQGYIIYELHVGTYTPEGTFEAIIPHLDTLVDLGVTALELMPIAQFAGDRNWGYDGVFHFAVQNTYGGPRGLQTLVDACHRRGLAVILDVVYNHFGPEGNCATRFGPYTTDNYRTPWGAAMNVDGPHSDQVRAYFIENALYWFHDLHIDALRLDATHFIYDFSARPFMEELIATVHEHRDWLNRRLYIMAENDLNDARLLRPPAVGGTGFDAIWNDDFHHALHTVITREDYDYYMGFGGMDSLAKAIRHGFVFTGQYSEFRLRRHGTPSDDIPGKRFIVFAQNHDQIGNRMPAERLTSLVSFEALKLAIGVVALSPYVIMLFMGDEYAEPGPFHYFTSFQDEFLIDSVRKGRKEQFKAFIRDNFDPPDPQAESTFLDSKLHHDLKHSGKHRVMFEFYKTLFRLRKTIPALRELDKDSLEVVTFEAANVLYLRRWHGDSAVFAAFNFGDQPSTVALPVPVGYWCKELASADAPWREDAVWPSAVPVRDDQPIQSLGELELTVPPCSFVLYSRVA